MSMEMEEAERRITAALIAYDGARWSAQADFEEAREVAAIGRRIAERIGGPLAAGLEALGRSGQTAAETFERLGLQIERAGR